MQPTDLKKLSAILLLFLISAIFLLFFGGCAGLPPDEPLCTEITHERGYCVRMMSGKDFEINETEKFKGMTWWEMRPYMIQMPPQTWKELKTWIIKICKNNSQCDDAVSSWERTVEKIDKQAQIKSAD